MRLAYAGVDAAPQVRVHSHCLFLLNVPAVSIAFWLVYTHSYQRLELTWILDTEQASIMANPMSSKEVAFRNG